MDNQRLPSEDFEESEMTAEEEFEKILADMDDNLLATWLCEEWVFAVRRRHQKGVLP